MTTRGAACSSSFRHTGMAASARVGPRRRGPRLEDAARRMPTPPRAPPARRPAQLAGRPVGVRGTRRRPMVRRRRRLAAPGLTAVVVPKLESAGQLGRVAAVLGDVPVVAGLETVRGVVDARHVLVPPVVACYFGAEDYVADLGGVRTPDNGEVTYARTYVAMAARLAGVRARLVTSLQADDRFEARPVRPGRWDTRQLESTRPRCRCPRGVPAQRRGARGRRMRRHSTRGGANHRYEGEGGRGGGGAPRRARGAEAG